jgi:hypothetical protein
MVTANDDMDPYSQLQHKLNDLTQRFAHETRFAFLPILPSRSLRLLPVASCPSLRVPLFCCLITVEFLNSRACMRRVRVRACLVTSRSLIASSTRKCPDLLRCKRRRCDVINMDFAIVLGACVLLFAFVFCKCRYVQECAPQEADAGLMGAAVHVMSFHSFGQSVRTLGPL